MLKSASRSSYLLIQWAVSMLLLSQCCVQQCSAQAMPKGTERFRVEEQKLGVFHDPAVRYDVSKNGLHLLCAIKQDKQIGFQFDGQPLPFLCDEAGPLLVVVSDEGSHYAIVGKREGKWNLFRDGQATELAYAEIALPYISSDGDRVAYVARKGTDDRALYWVVEEKEIRIEVPANSLFDNLEFYRSHDLLHFATVTGSPGKPVLVRDGDAIQMDYDWIDRSSLVFDSTGTRLAFAGLKNGRWQVEVNGQAGPDFDEIETGSIQFSPDGRRLAYRARQGLKLVLVVDGQLYEYPWQISFAKNNIFSPSGSRWACLGAISEKGFWNIRSKFSVLLDNGQQQPIPEFEGVSHCVIMDNGRRAYMATKDRKWFMVLDDQPASERWDNVGHLELSQDGSRLAYTAITISGLLSDKKTYRVVVDGSPGPVYELVLKNGPHFSADGVVEFLAVREHYLYRVKYDLN